MLFKHVGSLALVAGSYASSQPSLRIVGGVRADDHEFPFLVSIEPEHYDDGSSLCGASLIAKNWVLTAAHCMDPLWDFDYVKVRFGRHHWRDYDSSVKVDARIEEIFIHPEYDNSDTVYARNDIALIRVPDYAHDIPESNWVKLTDQDFPVGEELTVAGWGLINKTTEEFDDFLQKVDVPTISDDLCNHWVGDGERLNGETLCAGTSAGGIDSCSGDSGGPFFRKEGDDWIQYGIVSWGNGCAEPEQPGVYTNVKFYRSWIEDIMATNSASVECTDGDVIKPDNTVRPKYNGQLCARVKNLRQGNKLMWDDCQQADGFKEQWAFDESTGFITSLDDSNKCWSVNANRGKKVVQIRKCEPVSSNSKWAQQFQLRDGKIWLFDGIPFDLTSPVNRFCVSFEGSGRTLKARRCYDDLD